MTDIDKQLIDNFLADLADNEWIIDDPYSPDMVEMPLYELEKRIDSLLTQSKEEAVKEEREICRQIFIDEVDWAEWSMSEIDAGKEFDEARASLTKTEGKE